MTTEATDIKTTSITLSDVAASKGAALLAQEGRDDLCLRVAVQPGGCSGLKYLVEYADAKGHFDEIISDKGVTVLVDPKALMYLLGTEMDYMEEKFKSGFTFTNPNEKGKCGCGSSFNV